MSLHRGVQLKPEALSGISETDLTGSILRVLAGAGLEGKLLEGRRWKHLAALGSAYPMMALLKDGSWVLIVNAADGPDGPGVMVLNPQREAEGAMRLTRAEFGRDWAGAVIVCRKAKPQPAEPQTFGLTWFIPEILRQRRYLRDVAVAATMATLIGFATPLVFQVLIDKAIGHHSYQTLGAIIIIAAILVVFDGLFAYTRQYLMLFLTNKVDARLASRTFQHLLQLPLHFFESMSAGALTRNLQQTETIRNFLTGRLFQATLDALTLPITVGLLAFYSLKLTLVVLVFSIAIAAVIGLIVPAFRHHLDRLYQAEGSRQAHLVETIHGMRTVKSLALEPYRLRDWDEAVATGVSRRASVGRLATLANVLTSSLEKSMQICVLGLGALDVFDGHLSIGSLIAFNMVAGRVTGPLIQIVGLVNESQETRLAVQMLGTVMQHPPERDPSRPGMKPPVTGRLDFDAVTYRYPGAAAPALDGVSFTVEPGQVIGIVGRSGSGKTTVTRLIQAIQTAQEGAVRLDGIDLRQIDLVHLRTSIGVVLQENFLFRGTIRDNIAAARPDAPLAEIVEAARMAGAAEFIERLPASYDTFVQENGANFSGGQRQRIAIARALVLRPRLLIFDEATSALDPESEAIIQEHLAEIAAGRTMVIVSHRLASLASADSILVLDRGRVVDYAPHATLLTRCDVYQRLWHQQTRHIQ
ncbi:peptidase domain-containing ABC transporter [Methylobacterium sp. ID0610]|uniref:peptidase domain-containing ABC transporter n=1 Tax=Methylobacterium carpenticola TaxID=3344827 RepID=UPI00368774E5